MGITRRIVDGLTNALTGLGTTADPRRGNRYVLCPLSHAEIEAAYRSSGLMRKVIDIPRNQVESIWLAVKEMKMSTRLIWVAGGSIFGALLSLALDNTHIGIAITAVIGGIAGGISEHLRRRPHS